MLALGEKNSFLFAFEEQLVFFSINFKNDFCNINKFKEQNNLLTKSLHKVSLMYALVYDRTMIVREAAKKVPPLVVQPLRGGGG